MQNRANKCLLHCGKLQNSVYVCVCVYVCISPCVICVYVCVCGGSCVCVTLDYSVCDGMYVCASGCVCVCAREWVVCLC